MPPVIFPFAPDDHADLKVVREWDTDILTSELGVEQRVSLRDAPRLRLSFGVRVLESHEFGALQGYLEHAGPDLRFYVPFWPDAVEVYGDVAAAGTLIPAATTGRRFVAGEFAMLWRTGDEFEVVEIAEDGVAPEALTIVGGTVEAWTAGSIVVPVMVGVLVTPTRLELLGPQSGAVTIEFQIETPTAGVALEETGETEMPEITSIRIDPQLIGQSSNTVAKPDAHWYYRARCYDALGTLIRNVVIQWTATQGEVEAGFISQSMDPAVIRFDPVLVTGNITLTATVGSVSDSVTVSV